MRRQDKELKDPARIDQVVDAAEWGVLGLVSPQGTPVLVPLNHVRMGRDLYFHSAGHGEKMDTLRAKDDATFLVVEAYATIPSYAFDPESACKASQLFTSVLLYGRVSVVEEAPRKAQVLEALMRKLQPEGGYRTITAEDPLYAAAVAGVTVLKLTVERVAAKESVGQKYTPVQRTAVTDLLERRGDPEALRTLQAMGGPGSPAPS
jgi:uncharacterized protein